MLQVQNFTGRTVTFQFPNIPTADHMTKNTSESITSLPWGPQSPTWGPHHKHDGQNHQRKDHVTNMMTTATTGWPTYHKMRAIVTIVDNHASICHHQKNLQNPKKWSSDLEASPASKLHRQSAGQPLHRRSYNFPSCKDILPLLS